MDAAAAARDARLALLELHGLEARLRLGGAGTRKRAIGFLNGRIEVVARLAQPVAAVDARTNLFGDEFQAALRGLPVGPVLREDEHAAEAARHLEHVFDLRDCVVRRADDGALVVEQPLHWIGQTARHRIGSGHDVVRVAHPFFQAVLHVLPGLLARFRDHTTKLFEKHGMVNVGYWVPLGWSAEAPVKTQCRIDVPRSGVSLDPGPTYVAGVAWAPNTGISQVEVQFDNGECGVAMFDLHELTKDGRHLDSARKAADWALARPLCANWNYNSFSVRLLARAFAATGEAKYLDAAVSKARLGVIPGQLTDGPNAGRWMDPHNARSAYHYVMMCALAQLAAVMPPSHEHRTEIVRALTLGLNARNSEMTTRGVMNKDHALAALLFVNRAFASDAAFLRETKSAEALHALALLLSAEAHRGKTPLSPGGWGNFLEHIIQTAK